MKGAETQQTARSIRYLGDKDGPQSPEGTRSIKGTRPLGLSGPDDAQDCLCFEVPVALLAKLLSVRVQGHIHQSTSLPKPKYYFQFLLWLNTILGTGYTSCAEIGVGHNDQNNIASNTNIRTILPCFASPRQT